MFFPLPFYFFVTVFLKDMSLACLRDVYTYVSDSLVAYIFFMPAVGPKHRTSSGGFESENSE